MEKRSSGVMLVTGASGFLGTAILDQAHRRGFTVRALSRREPAACPQAQFIRADICRPTDLLPAMTNVACVIHAAGLAHRFDSSEATCKLLMATNQTGTANVARAAAAAGVAHLVLLSSVSVYGHARPGQVDETTPCSPDGPYGHSKLGAEQAAVCVARESGMHLTILRLPTLYGEGDRGNVARLMQRIDRGRFFWVGSGSNRKSLLHRDDAARACLAALQRDDSGVNVYNVPAQAYPMREIVTHLAGALGKNVPSWVLPAPVALWLAGAARGLTGSRGTLSGLDDTLRKWLTEDVFDGTKFDHTFAFHPQVELEEGLRREVSWYKARLLSSP